MPGEGHVPLRIEGRTEQCRAVNGSAGFERRRALARAALQSSSILPGNQDPPLYRLLRKRWPLPPPHFCSFPFNACFNGAWFGAAWGAVMWFAFWSQQNLSMGVAAAGSVFAGAVFGLSMAVYFRTSALRHRLPTWESL